MENEVETASLLDAMNRSHVVPLVEDGTDLEAAELNIEARHLIIGGTGILVPHFDFQNSISLVWNWEVEFFVPTRLEGALADAGLASVVVGGKHDLEVGVR